MTGHAPRKRRRCWRDPTVEYGFARSQAPTWPAAGRNESETWCKGNGGTRACGNSCTKSPPVPRRKWPETWCKGNGGTRLCGVSCTKSPPATGRNGPETWCKWNGGARLCGNSCTKSPPATGRNGPETWCKWNGEARLCGNSCTKSPPAKSPPAKPLAGGAAPRPRYENNLHRLARWRTDAGCSLHYTYSNSKAPVYSW